MSMLTVLPHGQAEPETFERRNSAFVERFESLQRLVSLAFDREPSADPADLMVFCLGRRIASDFDDIVVLCRERRAESALALVRGMFERLITARYLAHHPDEATAFAEFDFIQRRKLARRIKEVLGLPTDYEEKLATLEANAARVEKQYIVDDCKECKTTKPNHTWNKLDVIAMASKTEKKPAELKTEAEREQAASARERLRQMTVFGYLDPMGHTHATLKSISSAFKEENGKLVATLSSHESVDSILQLAHLLLVESLLVQGERFELSKFDDHFTQAMTDFTVVWPHGIA